jgi:hypothetical protein
MLARSDPERSDQLLDLAQAAIAERWRFYEQLTSVERTVPHVHNHDEVLEHERAPDAATETGGASS